ncbi:PAS domain S-box protein [Spirochaetota bacterium]
MLTDSRKTLLLVEDEALIASAEKKQLNHYGYEVIHVLTGEKAVDIIHNKKEPVDLILMDIDLGKGLDGTETAEIILKDNDIPIVFLSSHTEPEIVEKTEKITSYGYVVKLSGITVIDASIKMAFKLFDANQVIKKELNERNKTEIALSESELRYRFLFQNLTNSFSLYEVITDEDRNPVDYKFLAVNPAYEKTVGVKGSTLLGKKLLEVFPKTEPYWIKILKKVVKTGKPELVEHYAREIDKYIEQLTYIPQKGQIAFIASDVTERKKIEESLRKSNDMLYASNIELKKIQKQLQSYESIIVNMTSSISLFEVIYDEKNSPVDYRYLLINQSYENATGINASDLIGKTLLQTFPKTEDAWLDLFREVSLTGIPNKIEHFSIELDKYYEIFAFMPRKGQLATLGSDITKRKVSEEELLASKNFLKEAQSMAQVGNWTLDVQTMEVTGSDELYHIFDLNREKESTLDAFANVVHPDDREYDLSHIKRGMEKGDAWDIEHRIICKDNSVKWIRAKGEAKTDRSGKIIMLIGTVQDITERKLVEEEILRSKILLESSIESPNDVIILSLDREYRYLLFNKFHEETMKNIYGTQPIIGECIFDFMKGNDDIEQAKVHYSRGLAGDGHSVIGEYGQGKTHHYYETSYNPIYNQKNEIIGVTAFAQNVTERKQTEAALQDSLQKNKDLLRELQHRAKNSFGMISSMLYLMQDSSISDDAKNVLKEAGSRIKAVSEMYNMLYSTDSVTKVRLDDYLNRVTSSMPVMSKNITIEKSFASLTIPVKTAIPIGIITTELLTNSLKHAFTDKKKGTINLSLKKKNKIAVIEVKDDGKGIPEAINISELDSFGLKLIDTLINQIQGNLEIKRDKGTRCVLEFPVD